MLRADDVICGTSTTGTGTLTLAACPGPPGGLDFDKWLKATGLNFASGNTTPIPVSYTIIEFTDGTFTTEKQREKGIGGITLGASITAATLARTTVQSTVTGLNTSTPAPTFAAPTAITIGTAANTLVFVGAGVADLLPSFGPYTYDPNGSGIAPLGMSNGSQTPALVNGTVMYVPFYWHVPMLVKTIQFALFTGLTGGTTSSAYGAIYAPLATGTPGAPGKLLIDFGALGPSNPINQASFNSLKSASHASGFYLTPGAYWAAIFTAFAAGTNSPTLLSYAYGNGAPNSNLGIWLMGSSANNGFGTPLTWASATASANPAPDPAGLTSLFAFGANGGAPIGPMFYLGT